MSGGYDGSADDIRNSTYSPQTLADQLEAMKVLWLGTLGGSAGVYTATNSPVVDTYVTGQEYRAITNHENTITDPTLNIDSIGARTIKDKEGNSLFAGFPRNDELLVLVDDGTDLRWMNGPERPFLLHRDATTNIVESTSSETTLVSYSVPANLIGSDRGLRFEIYGHIGNNATNATFRVRCQYGSTEFFDHTTGTYGADANLRPMKIVGEILGRNGTSAQYGRAEWMHTFSTVQGDDTPRFIANDAGTGNNLARLVFAQHLTMAEDSTGALTLDISVQPSSTNSSIEISTNHFVIWAI